MNLIILQLITYNQPMTQVLLKKKKKKNDYAFMLGILYSLKYLVDIIISTISSTLLRTKLIHINFTILLLFCVYLLLSSFFCCYCCCCCCCCKYHSIILTFLVGITIQVSISTLKRYWWHLQMFVVSMMIVLLLKNI